MKDNAYQKRKERITARRLSLLPVGTFQRILDIGCGNGELSQRLGEKVHAQDIFGIEIVPEWFEQARAKGIKVEKTDVNKGLPFENNFFDLVFAGEIIEHVTNPDFFLREVHRVLRDGGILVLTTPNLASWYNRILLGIGIQPYNMEASTEDARVGFGIFRTIKNAGPAGHVRIFTLFALRDLLRLHGFELEKVLGYPLDSFYDPIFFFDQLFSLFPLFASQLAIRARKK